LKIQWVWWKTAHQLALLPVDELKQAIETFDLKYFQSIKWIGPKTAKRILVEMKHTLKDNDLIKLQGDQQAIKNIVSSLVGLWYQKSAIQELLKQYDEIISKDTLPVVMKRLIDRL
jgi:Holliday junction resolvasome RuvABC DNA-binding subunit